VHLLCLFLLFPNHKTHSTVFLQDQFRSQEYCIYQEARKNNCHFLKVFIENTNRYYYFYLDETHTYRPPLKMVQFRARAVAQETEPCKLSTPPRFDIAIFYELVHTRFMNIKQILLRNSYSNKFLERCIRQFLNTKHEVTRQCDSSVEHSSPKYVYFNISPYLPIWGPYLTAHGRNSAALSDSKL